MCRWLAYSGPPVYLDSVLLKPEHSLIQQSLRSLQSRTVTNGDGFGVGWYGDRPVPGLFRDNMPAWNDENLQAISEQIRSLLFLAHVRSSTLTSTSRVNCHPFRHGKWLFMHNGEIGGFPAIRRELAMAVAPELYSCIQGATDSEVFFYLLITNGLEACPEEAMGRTIQMVERAMDDHGIDEPFLLTAAVSDGATLYAVRYARFVEAPTLYYGCGVQLDDTAAIPEPNSGNAIFILSEPLDFERENWISVPPGHMVVAGDGAVAVTPFHPAAATPPAAKIVPLFGS